MLMNIKFISHRWSRNLCFTKFTIIRL